MEKKKKSDDDGRCRPVENKNNKLVMKVIMNNLFRGWMVGICGSFATDLLRTLATILGGKAKNPMRTLIRRLKENSPEYKYWGYFMALNMAIFNGMMSEGGKRVLEFLRKNKIEIQDHYRPMIAGFLSGLAVLALPTYTRPTMALYAGVRAFAVLVKMAVRRGHLPYFEHADVLLMSAASSQLMSCFVYSPRYVGETYRKFLTRQVQFPRPVVHAIGTMAVGEPLSPDLRQMLGTQSYDDAPYYGTQLLTQGQSFAQTIIHFFIRGLSLAVPVYIPVFTIPTLLFTPSLLIRNPGKALRRILQGITVSSLFLSAYCTIGISSILTLRRFAGVRHRVIGNLALLVGPIAGALAGTAVLIDRKSRRSELALFVFAHAVTSIWNFLREKLNRGFPHFDSSFISRYGDVAIFSTSLGIVMHAFVRYPNMIKRFYSSIMGYLYDQNLLLREEKKRDI